MKIYSSMIQILKSKYFLPVLLISLLTAESAFGSFLIYNLKNDSPYLKSKPIASNLLEEAPPLGEGEISDAVEEEIAKNPPKIKTSGTRKKVSTSQGEATIVSTGSITDDDLNKLQDYADDGPASTISYHDTTGRYPSLGTTLINYLYNTLLSSSSERAYMYEIEVIDCSTCDYGGLYTGSYLYGSGSDITKAFGWIKLNSYWYKDSAYFTDYMKLIFSHEYGHHYTLYHRWVDLDIPSGDRWPASYYSNRPLSLATTAADYSKGWSNCDVEIMAEDYSYFFSGYGQHAMSGVYGYPSGAISSWMYSLSSTAPTDNQAPSVSITSPSNGATVSGAVIFSANATDNVGVTRVEFIVDGGVVNTDSSAPYSMNWSSASVSNGSHSLKAKAYDSFQSSEATINVTVNNVGGDSENPSVVINQPASNPYNWSSDNLIVEATGSDNVGVVKMEFYINGLLAATELDSHIIRLWEYAPTPPGSYQLSAKAYDAAGNYATTSVTINKS